MFGNVALFPGDFGMSEIGDKNSDSGGNECGKPEEVVVSNDEIRKNSVKAIVEDRNADADKKVAGGVFAGLDVFGLGSIFGIFVWCLVRFDV